MICSRPRATGQPLTKSRSLAKGADVIVRSAIHPIMGTRQGQRLYPYAYYSPERGPRSRRHGAPRSANYLMLTHLIPTDGATQQYPSRYRANH